MFKISYYRIRTLYFDQLFILFIVCLTYANVLYKIFIATIVYIYFKAMYIFPYFSLTTKYKENKFYLTYIYHFLTNARGF